MAGWSTLVRRTGGLLDTLVRWVRLPRPVPGPGRRFVIIQVDGLSHEALEQALARGYMPATARLLRRGRFRLTRIPVGLPTSTPAFQAAIMYGGPVDIPAFEFLDKRTGEYLWFPRPWASARVEAAHAEGRRGIMRGGRTYGCVFGGGAGDTILTLAHLLRPWPLWGRFGIRARGGPLVLLGWVSLKMIGVAVVEFLGWTGRALRDFALGSVIPTPKRLLTRLVISGWLRELFTLGVTQDIYAGVPALYVNFVDYDVPAHALGPGHPAALRALRLVDASVRDVWRAARRVPEFRYDVFILSDHGQIRSIPFEAVEGTPSAADAVLEVFREVARARSPEAASVPAGAPDTVAGQWSLGPVWQRHLAYLEPRARERNALWAGPLCVVPAGPNINVYLTDVKTHAAVEEIEGRYPSVLARLSRHRAIGLVLARGSGGPVCYYRGAALRIPPPPGPTGCPLFDRTDRDLVVREVQNLLAMPSAGDIVLYGHYTAWGCVNFLGERGSHAGPSEDELYGFIMTPPGVEFDFRSVDGPAGLYRFFLGYQDAACEARGTDDEQRAASGHDVQHPPESRP